MYTNYYTDYDTGGLGTAAIVMMVIGIAVNIACCYGCVTIAKNNGREPFLFGVLGFCLSLLGLLITFLIASNSTTGTNQANTNQTINRTASSSKSLREAIDIDEWYLDLPFEIIEQKLTISQDKSETLLSLKMMNIGEKTIRSIYFVFECFDDTGEPSCKGNAFRYAYQDLKVAQYGTFGQDVFIKLPDAKTRKINIRFQKMAFTDGSLLKLSDLQHGKEKIIKGLDYITRDKMLLLDDSVKNSRFIARYKPVFMPNGKWACVCGRTNRNSDISCARCHRDKADIRINFDPDVLKAKKGKQEQIKSQEAKEEKLKNKKRIKIGIAGLIFIVAIAGIKSCYDATKYKDIAGTYYIQEWNTEDPLYAEDSLCTSIASGGLPLSSYNCTITADGTITFPYTNDGSPFGFWVVTGEIQEDDSENGSYLIKNGVNGDGEQIGEYAIDGLYIKDGIIILKNSPYDRYDEKSYDVETMFGKTAVIEEIANPDVSIDTMQTWNEATVHSYDMDILCECINNDDNYAIHIVTNDDNSDEVCYLCEDCYDEYVEPYLYDDSEDDSGISGTLPT